MVGRMQSEPFLAHLSHFLVEGPVSAYLGSRFQWAIENGVLCTIAVFAMFLVGHSALPFRNVGADTATTLFRYPG
jgi:hypothetical protein